MSDFFVADEAVTGMGPGAINVAVGEALGVLSSFVVYEAVTEMVCVATDVAVGEALGVLTTVKIYQNKSHEKS